MDALLIKLVTQEEFYSGHQICFSLISWLNIQVQPVFLPIGTNIGIVGDLVVIDSSLALLHEPVLLTVGPDAGCSQEGLLKVRVDGGTSDRLQTLQLMRGGHIEMLM